MISIQWPAFLILLPLPFLVFWWLNPAEPTMKALRVPFFTRLRELFTDTALSIATSSYRWWGLLGVWSLLVIACANPVWLGEPIAIKRSGRAVLLAVDLSGSMKQSDMRWQARPARRIDIVKKVAVDFIKQRPGDRLGLILFGSNAYLQTPLTFDLNTVQDMLSDATLGLAGNLTAMGDAIGLAIKSFEKIPDKEKVLVLLTDGASNAGHVGPLEVAQIAAQKGIRIYTIGLGANQMQQSTFMGMQTINPSQDLDEKTLQSIANMTKGLFFRVTSTQDLQSVYSELNKLEPIKAKSTFLQPKAPIYPWLIAFAGLLAALLFFPTLFSKERSLVSL